MSACPKRPPGGWTCACCCWCVYVSPVPKLVENTLNFLLASSTGSVCCCSAVQLVREPTWVPTTFGWLWGPKLFISEVVSVSYLKKGHTQTCFFFLTKKKRLAGVKTVRNDVSTFSDLFSLRRSCSSPRLFFFPQTRDHTVKTKKKHGPKQKPLRA